LTKPIKPAKPKPADLDEGRQEALVQFLINGDPKEVKVTESTRPYFEEAAGICKERGLYDRILLYADMGAIRLGSAERDDYRKAAKIKQAIETCAKEPRKFFEAMAREGLLRDGRVTSISVMLKEEASKGSVPALDAIAHYYELTRNAPALVGVGDSYRSLKIFDRAMEAYLTAMKLGENADKKLLDQKLLDLFDSALSDGRHSSRLTAARLARIAAPVISKVLGKQTAKELEGVAAEVGDRVTSAYLQSIFRDPNSFLLDFAYWRSERQDPKETARTYLKLRKPEKVLELGTRILERKKKRKENVNLGVEILGMLENESDANMRDRAATILMGLSREVAEPADKLLMMETASKLNPAYEKTYAEAKALSLGGRFLSKGDPEDFESAITIAVDHELAEVVRDLAASAVKKGKKDLAVKAFGRIGTKDLERFLTDGRYKEVSEAAREALALRPAKLLQSSAVEHLKAGRADLARVYLGVLKELGVEDPLLDILG